MSEALTEIGSVTEEISREESTDNPYYTQHLREEITRRYQVLSSPNRTKCVLGSLGPLGEWQLFLRRHILIVDKLNEYGHLSASECTFSVYLNLGMSMLQATIGITSIPPVILMTIILPRRSWNLQLERGICS